MKGSKNKNAMGAQMPAMPGMMKMKKVASGTANGYKTAGKSKMAPGTGMKPNMKPKGKKK
jgi:hypothetical protein